MGCWNKTCGLSRLFIGYGEPVYVFVLEQNMSPRERCYSTALFSPLLLPFEADYDDYGGGEEERGVALSYIIEGLKENLIEVEEGENEYHDIPVKREGFDVTAFFESVHEGRLAMPGHHWSEYNANRPIDFVMVRQDVVHHILKEWKREAYVGDGKGTTGWNNNYIQYTFADVLADVDAFLDRALQKMEDAVADEDPINEELKRYRMRYRGFPEGLASVYPWSERAANKVSWFVRHDRYRYSQIVDINGLILDKLTEGDRDHARELLVCHLTGLWIDEIYNSTRNIWTPGCHEGSQAQEPDGYRILTSTINWVLDEQAKKYSED